MRISSPTAEAATRAIEAVRDELRDVLLRLEPREQLVMAERMHQYLTAWDGWLKAGCGVGGGC